MTRSTTNYSGPCSGVVLVPSYQDWSKILFAIINIWSAEDSPDNYYRVILGQLRSGAHAPILAAASITRNVITHITRINWSASDPDRDQLHYLVRASTDQGSTWQTIGVNLDQPQIELDPMYFNGQPVLIEVLASDGVHTSQLNLGPYFITNNK